MTIPNALSPDKAVMLGQESNILAIIEQHQGKESAISADLIGDEVELTAREVRRLIRRLRLVFHCLIGSGPGKPPGFYMIANERELKEVTDRWMKFALRNIIMVAKLRRTGANVLIDQIKLDLDHELNLASDQS